MRLLYVDNLELQTFYDTIPPYVILSHTWGEQEVSFTDIQTPFAKSTTSKRGFEKIARCCKQAKTDGYDYAWIDTCCIETSSSSELSEAINTMFRWYKNSSVCYAYLSDVETLDELRLSRWWTRGWTLQELIAPSHVIFFSKTWDPLGTKESLASKIVERTRVDYLTLLDPDNLPYVSVARRMSWMWGRQTSRREDTAYCLLGIFDVNMPLLYGEGEKAFIRLQEHIISTISDPSLLAWAFKDCSDANWTSLSPLSASICPYLAPLPNAFRDSSSIQPFHGPAQWNLSSTRLPWLKTNRGLQVTIPLCKPQDLGSFALEYLIYQSLHIGILECSSKDQTHCCIGIPLLRIDDDIFVRAQFGYQSRVSSFSLPVAAAIPTMGLAQQFFSLLHGLTNKIAASNCTFLGKRCFCMYWSL